TTASHRRWRGALVLETEVLSDALESELVAERAGTVLIREHTLLPEGLLHRDRHVPLHGEHPLRDVIILWRTFRTVVIAALERLVGKADQLVIRPDKGLVESHRLTGGRPYTHVTRLRHVHVDSRSDGHRAECARIPMASACRDEGEAPRVLPAA